MEEAVSALQTLYLGTNPAQKQQANQWLQEFVNRVESWTICDQMLQNPALTHEIYYFAAQTLHTKAVSALEDLPQEARHGLRQSLLSHLARFKASPQIITIQLSLALAALALQMEDWANPVQDVTQHFGSDSSTLSLLLDFLTVLPDECENPRIPLTRDRRKRFNALLLATAPTIVAGLLSYSRSSPGNTVLHNRVFSCLLAWIKTEAVPLETLANSEFVPLLFESLATEALFDTAVDSLCEIVQQTRDMKVPKLVQDLLTRIPQLIPPYRNSVATENTDVARGIARIFVGAGEAYLFEIIGNFEVYGILTELILECTAHKDLDIAQISFNFWFQLAEELPSGDYREVVPKFYSAYSRLMGIIIEHLKYPDEGTKTWTAEQKDDFKDFRHVVGDTLKDCCAVLGGQKALQLVCFYYFVLFIIFLVDV
jgi:transportin-3